MKKNTLKLFLIFFIALISLQSISSTTVFITSDYVIQEGTHDFRVSENKAMLQDIKELLEEKSNGKITVIIDDKAPSPGEVSRAANSNADFRVYLAAACPGTMLEAATSSYKSDKAMIYVNTGFLDLTKINFLRRAWDDDWSDIYFSGISKPSIFLDKAGVHLIQLNGVNFFNNDKLSKNNRAINEYIANEIVEYVNKNEKKNKSLDSSLVMKHKISPVSFSNYSKMVVKDENKSSYGKYSSQQFLYLATSYIYGYPLEEPPEIKSPSDPLNKSSGVKESYSIEEYSEIAKITHDYMKENKQAPNYVDYQGARISYNDLVNNFAGLTDNISSKEDMNLPKSYEFKVNQDNNLIVFYIIAIIFIVFFLLILRKYLR